MKRIVPLLVALAFTLTTSAVRAQNPVKVAEKNYKVEFENDHVRVLRIQYAPGDKTAMHSHSNSVVIFLTDQKAKFTYPDGSTSNEVTGKAGEAQWINGGRHEPENVIDKPLDLKGKAGKSGK
jgi:quercetin dioxygenase-like cupin family protein